MSHHRKPHHPTDDLGQFDATPLTAGARAARTAGIVVAIGSRGVILGRPVGIDLPAEHDARPITAAMFGGQPSVALAHTGDDDGGEAA